MPAGKLIFAAGNVGDYDIFLYDLNCGKLAQLTSDTAWNDYPRFSPDASKIAYGSTRSGKQEIWLMNADGSGGRSLTAGLKWADFPTWSPDGKEIAFVSNEYFQMDLFSLQLETGKLTRLTNNDNFDCYPDWSPDGKYIAYSSQRGAHQDIYIVDLKTLEEKRMTSHPGPDTSPSFSPDGTKIAFVSHRPNQNHEFEFVHSLSDFFHGNEHLDIWTADLATGNLRQMTTNRGVDRNSRWSPDGKYLAYTSASVDKTDARIMLCEYDTDKNSPLQLDETMMQRELERPFLDDLKNFNKPLTPEQLAMSDGKMGDLEYKLGLKMLPHIDSNSPGWERKLKEILDKYTDKLRQRVADKIHPVTVRYLDWK
jgi:Tol biopolymer transport system component